LPKTERSSYGGGPIGVDLWRIPLLLCLAVVALSAITLTVDRAAADGRVFLPAWISIGGIDDARAILGAMLSAVSTVLALIFSVALLVLSMAVNMLGPRLLYRFIRDGITQFTIGMFLATFLQILLAFVVTRGAGNRQFVPQLTLATSVLLTLASFGCLVVYSHRVAMSIQTDRVVARIVEDLNRMLAESARLWAGAVASPGKQAGSPPSSSAQEEPADIDARSGREGGVIRAEKTGYLERIDHDRLIATADHADAVLRLAFRPGQFVMRGSILAHVLPAPRADALSGAVCDAVVFGPYRILGEDLEFAIAQLVEIGLRALSPAVNDTFTGIRCVDRLGDALREFAAMPAFDGAWRGADGRIRLVEPPLEFPHVVKAAFDKIRQAAVGTPAVMIRMLETWTRLAPLMRTDEQRQALLEQVEALWEAASSASLVRMDRKDVEAAYRAARGALAGA
jgi:uncharacterized membrane protein